MGGFSTISSAALFLAGLAFFFHGLDGVRDSLKSMAGRQFRKRVSRLTASAALAAFWGFILGAVAQSASAASFIVSGFVSSRLLPLRRGLTMVAWANLGTVLLPFVASFNIRPRGAATSYPGVLQGTSKVGAGVPRYFLD
jgi:phosphate:Na+ symporter